jgi:hypothetical protein
MKIRKKKIFENSYIFVIPESNCINIATDIRDRFKTTYSDVRDVEFYHDAFNDKKFKNSNNAIAIEPGSATDKKTRPIMVTTMFNILEKKTIIFFQDFIVSQKASSNLLDVKAEIKNQFSSFSRQTIYKPDRTKVKYHGKIKGSNDDFVLAILINIFCAAKIIQDNRHR